MKRIFLVIFSFFALLMTGCPAHDHFSWRILNNASYDIYVWYEIILPKHLYPDTTLCFGNRQKITRIVKSNSSYKDIDKIRLSEFIRQNTPNDTLSFFFFHADTIEKYPLEIIQRDYSILRRYDLSSQDIVTLSNQYGVPEIPYPPNDRMRNMKMWPPYGQ